MHDVTLTNRCLYLQYSHWYIVILKWAYTFGPSIYILSQLIFIFHNIVSLHFFFFFILFNFSLMCFKCDNVSNVSGCIKKFVFSLVMLLLLLLQKQTPLNWFSKVLSICLFCLNVFRFIFTFFVSHRNLIGWIFVVVWARRLLFAPYVHESHLYNFNFIFIVVVAVAFVSLFHSPIYWHWLFCIVECIEVMW